MRITVLDNDPGRQVNLRCERFRVLLDGVEVKRCVTADDEAGEVVLIAEIASGKIQVAGGEVQYVTRHGNVTIEALP